MRLSALSTPSNKPLLRQGDATRLTYPDRPALYFSGKPSLIKALELKDPKQLTRALQDGADIHEKYQELCCGQTFLLNLFGINKRVHNEMNGLHVAVDPKGYSTYQDTRRCLEILLEQGLNINAIESDTKWTPLHRLMYGIRPDPRIVQFLIDKGVDVNAKDNYGKTALHEHLYPPDHLLNTACLSIVKILVENGADIYAKDNLGRTPLHYLAQRQSPKLDIVQYCINTGATKQDRLALKQEFLSQHQKYLTDTNLPSSSQQPSDADLKRHKDQVAATIEQLEQSLSVENAQVPVRSAPSNKTKKASQNMLSKSWQAFCNWIRCWAKAFLDLFRTKT